ncbi:MAG: acyltransferase [Cytophagales bacterium]|nr:acyltransferase [Cytophagales bacterium]
MTQKQEYIPLPKVFQLLEKYDFLFFWLRWFYPQAKGVNPAHLLFQFIPQKIFRTNGNVPWPVHKTSLVLHHKNIQTGNNSPIGINIGCYIQGKGGIKVGNNVRLGPHVGLISANHAPEDYDLWIKVKPIEIGNNVWIGMNSVVMPGVSIGDNVIIGANSTVNKDIPSNSIAVGNPCRVIKEKEAYKGKTYE